MASPSPEAVASPSPPISAEVVTSSEILTSIYASLIGGFLFYACWAIFRGPLRTIYLKRTQLPDLRWRPPPLALGGLVNRLSSFFLPTFLVSDGELLQTAGLDTLMLIRFLVLGVHVFAPVAALCCAVLIPLCMSGKVVSGAQYASVSAVMRYSLSNIEEGSGKLWVSFALSYVVLGWVGYCLVQHYISFALYRLLQLRLTIPAGGPPRMAIAGADMELRGFAAAKDTIFKLFSPLYMVRSDRRYVKRAIEAMNAAEAAAAAAAQNGDTAADKPAAAAAVGDANGSAEEDPLLPKGEKSSSGSGPSKYANAAVLPWWLPPEDVPPEFSAALGTSGVIAGKTCPALRKRVHTTTPAGRSVFVSVEQYAVLFNAAGPPPSKELWGMLSPPRAAPAAVLVDGGKSGSPADEAGSEEAAEADRQEDDSQDGQLTSRSSYSKMELVEASQGQAGAGAEVVATQLTVALQDLFPGSFTQLVRVYNHKAVDVLLGQHEVAATKRDHSVTALAAAQRAAKAAEGGPKADKAAAKLAKAEAELAAAEKKVAELEGAVEAARKEALSKPLGTAFIALFNNQTAAATAASVRATLVPSVNFTVRPCPGPDEINWGALWTSWWSRMLRGLAVLPIIVFIMLFPIGVLTGTLTNLSTAVCSNPATNTLYWAWYCEQTSFGAKLLKNILQGILPSVISMLWDTYVLPMAFIFTALSEYRHLALSDLDRRVTLLFFNFNIFNTFLGSVLGGAVFQQIGNMVDTPGKWLQMLGTSLPSASTYFLNYLIIHTLSTNWFRYVWPHEGTVLFVIFRWLGMCRPKCERDHTMIRTPPSYRGARHYGSFLLTFIMGLTYAVIAPLVLPVAFGFFLTAWMTWRYCALYFYERSYESGGRLFSLLFTLVVWTMAAFTIFTSIVLAAKRLWSAGIILLITQLVALMIFHKRVQLRVGHYARHLPLHATLAAPTADIDPAIYLPPPLRKQAVGWYPEWGKVWEKYGIGRYSL